jgi:hypothetical protein
MWVAMAASRLRARGCEVPDLNGESPSHRLYALLASGDRAGAYSRFNALVAQDLEDIREMIVRGLVDPPRLRELYSAVEDQLYRYPAIDPASLRRRMDSV